MNREKYLEARGWKLIGQDSFGNPIWQDPKYTESNKKPTRVKAAELPQPGGGTETVHQMLCDPSPWTYATLDAYAIEKSRETSGLSLEALIAKKREELQSLEDLQKETQDGCAVLNGETVPDAAGVDLKPAGAPSVPAG